MMSVGLTFDAAAAARSEAGLIGPNAVLQLAAALRAATGRAPLAEQVFQSAGLLRLLHNPPDAMIDEAIPARLFEALWWEMPAEQASYFAYDAGRRTGAYVLANRIPALAQLLLRSLPQRLACALLLKAIRRNAWTFVGSGICDVEFGAPALVTIVNNPLAMPGCIWHVGVLEQLFRKLVNKNTHVSHVHQRVNGQPVSRFEIAWRNPPARAL